MDSVSEKKPFITVKDICLMGILTALIVAQEYALSFIPNVCFTHLFITLSFFVLGYPKTAIVVLCYTLLDNLLMGSFNLMYAPAIIVMWQVYPLMLFGCTKLFKNRRIGLAIVAAIHSVLYCWSFVLVFTVFYQFSFKAYMIADWPYQLILLGTAFITVLLLFPPLEKALKKWLNKEKKGQEPL